MATLTGKKIKNTYDALLKLSDNDNLTTTAKQVTDGFGNNAPLYISTTQIGIGVTPEVGYDLHVYSDAKVGGNLTITGDLTVNGTTTTVDTDTLRVEDPLIELARLNTSADSVDIGFYGKYHPSGTTLYSGLFRDAGDDKYKLFKDLQTEPTTTVNTSGTGYARADLVVSTLEFDSLKDLGESITITKFVDEADGISNNDNDTTIPTSAAVKDYVDNNSSNTLAQVLAEGDTTGGGNIVFGDQDSFLADDTLMFGASNDLVIYHNGSHSFIREKGTGNLYIDSDVSINLRSYTGAENMLVATKDGSVDLYYDASKKLETTTTGVTVTGAVSATTFSGQLDGTISSATTATTQTAGDNSTKVATTAYVDNSVGGGTLATTLSNGNTTGGTNISVSADDDIDFSDSSEARFGSDQDLIVKHNGTQGVITNNTGTLQFVQNTNDGDIKFFCDDGSGGTENYFQIDGGEQRIKVFNEMRFSDNVELRLGTGNDLRIKHNTTNSLIDNYTGDLYLRNFADDKDIIFQSDDGSGGVATYMIIDGSSGNVGIGTTSPAAPLQVVATGVGSNGTIGIQGANAHVGFKNSSGTFRSWVGHFNATGHGSDADLNIKTGYGTTGNIRFTADGDTTGAQMFLQGSNARVGIGTVSPQAHIHINSGTANTVAMFESTDTATTIKFKDSTGTCQIETRDDFRFASSGGEKMRIENGGNVGIGQTSPDTILHITKAMSSSPTSNIYLDISGTNTAGGGGSVIFNTSATAGTTTNYNAAIKGVRDSQDNGSSELQFFTTHQPTNIAAQERMRIDSSGNVGIGTTSPSSKLHTEGVLTIKGSNTATGGSVAIQDNYSGANHLGNIGWNRSAGGPYFSYGLKQDGSADWKSTFANFSGKRTFARLDEDSFTFGFAPAQNTAVDSVVTNVTEKIKFDLEDTRVGIGTTSPSYSLHIASTGDAIIKLEADTDNVTESDNPEIHLTQDGGAVEARIGIDSSNDAFFWQYQSNDIKFGTNNTERWRIESDGDILHTDGNLTMSGSTPFIVLSNTSETESGITLVDSADSGQSAKITYDSGSSRLLKFYNNSTNVRMVINNSGNVGIGTTSPDGILQVNNSGVSQLILGYNGNSINFFDGDSQRFRNAAGTERFRMYSNGDFHADGDVVAYSTSISDARLKDNVKPLRSSLDKIMNLKGVEYIWNNGSRKGQKDIGFIAQEVEDVIPEIVKEKEVLFNEGTKYKTIDYEKITAVLVEAVKELQQEIVELKKQIK